MIVDFKAYMQLSVPVFECNITSPSIMTPDGEWVALPFGEARYPRAKNHDEERKRVGAYGYSAIMLAISNAPLERELPLVKLLPHFLLACRAKRTHGIYEISRLTNRLHNSGILRDFAEIRFNGIGKDNTVVKLQEFAVSNTVRQNFDTTVESMLQMRFRDPRGLKWDSFVMPQFERD